MSATILIVEDEQDLLDSLEYAFVREGYAVIRAATLRAAEQTLDEGPRPDLVLLDLMLPDGSGAEVCRLVRGSEDLRETPLIMMTAKGEEIDRVVGFELGADDYVAKPFSTRELVLRVKAILRRMRPADLNASDFRFGVLRIDEAGHRVWVDDAEIQLTALEFRLLSTFVNRRGRVQTRDALLHDVWGHHPGLTTRTVDTHIQRLRRKIGPAAPYIETLRGVGYRFRTRPETGFE